MLSGRASIDLAIAVPASIVSGLLSLVPVLGAYPWRRGWATVHDESLKRRIPIMLFLVISDPRPEPPGAIAPQAAKNPGARLAPP